MKRLIVLAVVAILSGDLLAKGGDGVGGGAHASASAAHASVAARPAAPLVVLPSSTPLTPTRPAYVAPSPSPVVTSLGGCSEVVVLRPSAKIKKPKIAIDCKSWA